MMKLTVKKGDLFVPFHKTRVLAHACNTKGMWGSGIAAQFKERFPAAHEDYKAFCRLNKDKSIVGTSHHFSATGASEIIASLFTSVDFGKRKDDPATILRQTETAVKDLLTQIPPNIEIHTPKINAGLFAVPWAQTEDVINRVLANFNHTWVVYEL